MRTYAEDLISEAYEAIVSGDSLDTAFDGETRREWFVGVEPDGTTYIY